jgi:cyanophycinase-like exopeptidase
MKTIFFLSVLMRFGVQAQNYTSYFTGNLTDATTVPTGGICLMGGSTESDDAIRWFLNRANGGDILVLRASGSDGYNDYFFSDLGIIVNSVETIVFNDATASNEMYVQQKIENAEAIWFAGGDQWNYIDYWRNTPVDSLINLAISERNIVVGGTSAGMAILGSYYFSAENGTVTSPNALANPFNNQATVSNATFIELNIMNGIITDTHYDSPDRKGRQAVFMAKVLHTSGVAIKGIACDEYTAVCIDELGIAKVFGDYPSFDDNAYFLAANCEVSNNVPEICTANTPLTWNQNGNAIKVYKVKGTIAGINTFDLNTWETGVGGVWENWSVENGVLSEMSSSAPNCLSASVEGHNINDFMFYPNPAKNRLFIQNQSENNFLNSVEISSLNGELILQKIIDSTVKSIDISMVASGIYLLSVKNDFGEQLSVKKISILND